ncbi:MAG: hypothetical protein H6586_08815, partial [Flavobacteriales bacterium]|nr:hypothetical protein [Flavobacteriales bacterium]
AVKEIDCVEVYGENHTNVFSITSHNIPIHVISEELHKLGWHLNDLPNGFHFCVTGVHVNHEGFADEFIDDLKKAVLAANERIRLNPQEKAKSGNGALYGTMNKIPPGFGGAIDETAREYYHVLWNTQRVVATPTMVTASEQSLLEGQGTKVKPT